MHLSRATHAHLFFTFRQNKNLVYKFANLVCDFKKKKLSCKFANLVCKFECLVLQDLQILLASFEIQIVQCCRQQVWFGKSMCKLCVHICKNGLVHLQTSIASLQTRLGILQMCFCCRISVWTFVLQMLFLRIRNFCVHLCKPWLVNLQYYIANLQNLVCMVCFANLLCLRCKLVNLANMQTFFLQICKLGLATTPSFECKL